MTRTAATILAVALAGAAMAQTPAPRSTPCEDSYRMQAAWEFMAAGNYMGAIRHFTREGSRDTTCGAPKIGYALAAAAMGDLDRAAKSMRQALWLDPGSVRAFRLDSRLRPMAGKLVDRCLLRLGADDTDKDVALLLATLYYVMRDEQGALYAIEVVRGNDDGAASAVNLDEMIIARFAASPPPEATAEAMTLPAVVVETVVEPPAAEAATEPAPQPVTEPVIEPATDRSPPAPQAPPVPAEPTEPIDYEKLRTNMQDVSNTLNSFAQKLIARIQKAKESLGQE